MNTTKKEEILSSVKKLFIEDYNSINSSKESVNKYLKIFDIEGYEYNTFCTSLLLGINNYLDTISDNNQNINISNEIKNILIKLVLDKVKSDGSDDLIELLSMYEEIFLKKDDLF